VLVFSGPNTGGKTVALKTTASQCCPRNRAFRLRRKARCSSSLTACGGYGDEQSIARTFSTFSSAHANLKSIAAGGHAAIAGAGRRMCTGTAEEGAALAVALLDEFRARIALFWHHAS